MSEFEKFNKEWGDPENKIEVPNQITAKYTGVLPDKLLEFWNVYGFSSFGSGFIWTVNPEDYNEIIKEWIDVSEYHPIVFMRNSFGGLLFWDSKLELTQYLNVIRGEVRVIISDISLLMNRYFSDKRFLNNDFFYDYHQKAYKNLSAVGEDECYAFEPAIAMGGDMDVDNITVRKTKPHLYLLSQVTEVVDLD